MLLDIAFGIFLGKYFEHLYLGIIFAILPDIDFIPNYIYDKTKIKFLKKFSHRGILHTPILYILIAIILFIFNFNIQIIYMFLIGTMFHLIHDLFVLGRGVMILYPFTDYRLKLFPDDGKDGYLKKKILWWSEKETPKYTDQFKQDLGVNLHNENWIKVWYLRPNIFLISETLLAIFFIYSAFII